MVPLTSFYPLAMLKAHQSISIAFIRIRDHTRGRVKSLLAQETDGRGRYLLCESISYSGRELPVGREHPNFIC